jgi:hypothetical protein
MVSDSVKPISQSGRNLTKYLLPLIALALGILFDRLIVNSWFPAKGAGNLILADRLTCVFWLCCLSIVIWMGQRGSKRYDIALWIGAAGCAALIVWFLIKKSDYNNYEFSLFARLAIPAVLMTLAQYAAYPLTLKDAGGIFTAFLEGWLIQPFSQQKPIADLLSKTAINKKNPVLHKVLIGLLITVPLLAVILPLLGSADHLFGYYLEQIFHNIFSASVVLHILAALAAALLFYSFLWNLNYRKPRITPARNAQRLDTVIWSVALISVLVVYTFFCSIQFTHLFARAGLPTGLTYAEYAREGFAQTVIVCGINLILFGMCLRFSERGKLLTVLLSVLLALTAVMLCSGFVRLKLYIDAFGMTWLRLVSGWFIIYLAVVLVLSAARLKWKKIPLIGVCALLLLVWFAVLGYINPDMFIESFNLRVLI